MGGRAGARLAWRTLLALRLPVVDYDGFSYHLVFVDVWLQHDALRLVPHRIWVGGVQRMDQKRGAIAIHIRRHGAGGHGNGTGEQGNRLG